MALRRWTLPAAISDHISEGSAPLVLLYNLGTFVFTLYTEKQYKRAPLSLRRPLPEQTYFHVLVKQLLENGVLRECPWLPPKTAFEIPGRKTTSPAEAACSVDPFCYISHLSAMELHGLTDRIPERLFISTPSRKDWKQQAAERMKRDLGERLEAYLNLGFPQLVHVDLKRIGKQNVVTHASKHHGAFRSSKDSCLRVSTMGRTFLDMLREPDRCGGIRHVLDVFRDHADTWLEQIVNEVDRHGKTIDKVRAGYVLEEVCGLNHQRIDQWTAFATRGGSRKLYAPGEYAPVWSERWCLSINLDY